MTWAIPPLRPGRVPEAPRRQPESRDQGHQPPADQEVAEVAGRERVGAAERLVVDLTHRAPLSAAYGRMARPDAGSAGGHRRVVPIPGSTNWRIRQTAAGGPASPRVCIMASPLPPVRQPGRARGAGGRGREGPRRRPPAELEAGGDTRREVIEGPTHALDRPASQLPEPRGTSPTNRRTARRTTCRSTFARFMPTQIAEKSPTSLQRWSGPSTGGWCR